MAHSAEPKPIKAVEFYEGHEVRIGIAYEPGEITIILDRFAAMHPDTADDMRSRGLFERLSIH